MQRLSCFPSSTIKTNATNPWRCSLLMALTVCLGGVFICEQPRQSLLYRHPRFRWLTTICTAPDLNINDFIGECLFWIIFHGSYNSGSLNQGFPKLLVDAFIQIWFSKATCGILQFPMGRTLQLGSAYWMETQWQQEEEHCCLCGSYFREKEMAWNQKSKGYRAFTSVVFTVNYWFCCTPSLTSIWPVAW